MLLQEYLTSQATDRADAVASVDDGKQVTYGELEILSNQLAGALKEAGCRRGDRVGVFLPRSRDTLVSVFGIFKADCVYVPLDPKNPPVYVARLLSTISPRVVLVDRTTVHVVRQLRQRGLWGEGCAVGWMDTERPGDVDILFDFNDVLRVCPVSLRYANASSDVAFIIFTSGSTGAPKAVPITHKSMYHCVEWMVKHFDIRPTNRHSMTFSLYFDASMNDIISPLAAGACLFPVPPHRGVTPEGLAQFIRESQLTHWTSGPWGLSYLARFDALRDNDFPSMRHVYWGGEVLPTPSLIYWMKKLPHVTFTNVYGPTETTFISSYYRVPRCPEDEQEIIPIGLPLEGEELLVLDDNLRRVGPGEVGELYIAGVGLSPGYWADPQKTSEVFLPNPFSDDPEERIYRTGDVAKMDENGVATYLGRADSQVQIRGARVEIGEVEAALHTLEYLEECAVVAITPRSFDQQAIGCVYSPRPGKDVSRRRLVSDLSERIPRHMIPTRWLSLPGIPRNPNGKIDRKKLRHILDSAS